MLYSGDRIIALATLKAFLNRSTAYAEARDPVMAWYRLVKAAHASGYQTRRSLC
jgi:hypothetical protein